MGYYCVGVTGTNEEDRVDGVQRARRGIRNIWSAEDEDCRKEKVARL